MSISYNMQGKTQNQCLRESTTVITNPPFQNQNHRLSARSESALLTLWTCPSPQLQPREAWTLSNMRPWAGDWNLARATTCYAWSPQHGHELELKPASPHTTSTSAPWTDCHEIICTSKSILLLSNRGALNADPFWGWVSFNCSFSEPQNHTWTIS